MMTRLVLCAVLVVGCTPAKDTEAADFEREVRENLEQGYFGLVSTKIDERVKTKGADKVAPLVTEAIVAKWSQVEKAELENAATMGKDRALGRGKDHCVGCTMFRKTLSVLAPASPDIDSRWKSLQPKLEQAEVAAYDAEANDKRPRVVIWQRGWGGANAATQLISMCVADSMKKSFPNYKWLLEDKAPAGDVAQFEVSGKTAFDKYVDSQTKKEAAQLLAGLRIQVMPRNLDSTLTSRFGAPLEATSTAQSPDTIRQDLPLGGPPTMETMRAGMQQLEKIRDEVCKTLDKEIQQAAAADTAAPTSSQKAIKQ